MGEVEATLTERISLTGPIRLACQVRPTDDIMFRRLVLDALDLRIASQLDRRSDSKSGELKPVAIFFSDVVGFTTFSERLPPYDVMYILNRYFAQVGAIIERNDGYIDKFVGDGLMSVFGIEDQPDAPLRAVNAALETLGAVDRLQPFFASMYDIEFDVRIGVHYGDAVVGSVGAIGHERVTVIGDVVNVASRIEAANKDAGTRFLISEPLYEEVTGDVEVSDFVRVRLRGTSDRITLYEIGGLTSEARARLHDIASADMMRLEGREWHRVMPATELGEGDYRVVEFPALDVVVARVQGEVVAFNNACPHLKLPFFNRGTGDDGGPPNTSKFTKDGQIECRWHVSRFDLHSGDINTWGEALNSDGTAPGFEMLGDISKNRAPLELVPTMIEGGDVWLAIGDS
jgi:class 3 adenylate cyclase/nitrite reductase/ring-hydroxylating ferredoxin subunit